MQEFRPDSVIREDAELARAVGDGDERAVRALYHRYGGLVFTVASHLVGDPGRAADISRQVFVDAWRFSDGFEPGRGFAPWLASITHDVAQNDPAEGETNSDRHSIEVVWTVRRAIETLDPADREIARLHDVEGCTNRQIAERLDLPLDTVAARSSDVHRRLTQRLGHLREAGGDDPIADIGASAVGIGAELAGSRVANVLGNAMMWDEPPSDLADRIAVSVAMGSGFEADVETETTTLDSGRGGLGARVLGLRPALLGAAAAVVVLVGGIVAFSAADGSSAGEVITLELVSTGEVLDVGGEATITAIDSGLRITIDAPSLPPRRDGRYYEGRVRLVGGGVVPMGTFQGGDDVTLSAGIEIERVASITIVLGEVAGGDGTVPEASGQVVLKADVPNR